MFRPVRGMDGVVSKSPIRWHCRLTIVSIIMSSIQEREAELAALQSAFDEYITSSRELEEELDAELAKMRKFT